MGEMKMESNNKPRAIDILQNIEYRIDDVANAAASVSEFALPAHAGDLEIEIHLDSQGVPAVSYKPILGWSADTFRRSATHIAPVGHEGFCGDEPVRTLLRVAGLLCEGDVRTATYGRVLEGQSLDVIANRLAFEHAKGNGRVLPAPEDDPLA
jgi:hypothetical protein